jgi:hypothetical protein
MGQARALTLIDRPAHRGGAGGKDLQGPRWLNEPKDGDEYPAMKRRGSYDRGRKDVPRKALAVLFEPMDHEPPSLRVRPAARKVVDDNDRLALLDDSVDDANERLGMRLLGPARAD